MSYWQEHDIIEKTIEVLAAVPTVPGHAFGRPYVTAYQLAIGLARQFPDTVAAYGQPLGGAGTGVANTSAQYVAQQLSRRIAADPAYPVEGAFLGNQEVESIRCRAPDGQVVISSLTGSGFDLSMFRLRD